MPTKTHTMHVLDKGGDTVISWNPENALEVDAARKTFEELTGQGFSAFKTSTVAREDKVGPPLTEFDPAAARIILTPRVVGGYPTDPALD